MASPRNCGNPLRSEREESRARCQRDGSQDKSGFLSCDGPTILGNPRRQTVLRSPERNPTWVWTLILSLSWLAQSSLQAAYRISLQSAGPAGHFNENFGGLALGTPATPFFIYNNYKAGDDVNQNLIRAYSETGTYIGSIDSLVSNARGPLNPVPNTLLVLGTDVGMTIFTMQTTGIPSTVAFTLDNANSKRFTLHSNGYGDSISEPDTVYSFSVYYSGLFPSAKFYRIDLFDLGTVLTKTLNSGMSMCLKLDFLDSQVMLGVGIGGLAYVRRNDLAFLRVLSNSLLGTYVVVDPTNNTIAYASSFQASPELLLKFDTSQTVFTNLAAPLNIFQYALNMVRLANFRLLALTLNTQTAVRLVDIDAFTLVLNAPVGGSLSVTSLRDGFTRGHHAYLSAVNPDNKRFELFDMHANYCLVPWQDPCERCLAGRYLSNTSVSNICWTTPEFPLRHGISGLQIAPCLGDLSLGCLSCVDDASKCLVCDNDSGFYLFARDSTCLKIYRIPAGFGLNSATRTIIPCLASNCSDCVTNNLVCSACTQGFYFREPSDGLCYPNNITNYGFITVQGEQRVAACVISNCGDCFASYLTCVKCAAGYFEKEDRVGCFLNNLEGYGLKKFGLVTKLAKCADPNCRLCQVNQSICTSCNPSWFVFQAACYQGQPKFGPDSQGYLQPCALGNCGTCAADYLVCTSCALPRYFVGQDTSRCILNDRDYFGLDHSGSPSSIVACKISNCRVCLKDATKCEHCENDLYPTIENSKVCVPNDTPGRGLALLDNKMTIKPCDDVNCVQCFANCGSCELCRTGFWVREDQQNSNTACFENNTPGFGLTAAVPPTIAACLPSNCADCFQDNRVCMACRANTYLSSQGPGCFTNNQKGYGLTKQAGSIVLDKCEVQNCENCLTDIRVCRQCASPFVFNPAKNECWALPVVGMGKSTDQNGFTILLNCTDPNCSNCGDSIGTCVACKSKWVLDSKTGLCKPEVIYNSSNPLTVKQPSFFDRRTGTFLLEFSEPVATLAQDLTSLLDFNLIVLGSSEVIASLDYSVLMKINSEGKVEGKITSSKLISESRLAITQKNQSQVVFANGDKVFDPSQTIYVENVAVIPLPIDFQTVSKASKAASTGLAIFSALSIGTSSTGGARLTTFIKVIEAIEYVLYINGIRVSKADQFIYLFSYDPMSFIPNVLDGGDTSCDPGHNFSREGVSCSFLRNEGSEFVTMAVMAVLFAIFWGLFRLVSSMKDSTLKSVLKGILYVPRALFGSATLLATFDGAQITIMRSYLIALVNITSESDGHEALGLLLGTGLMALYVYLGYCMWKYAQCLQKENKAGLEKLQVLKDVFEEFRLPTGGAEAPWRTNIYLLYPVFGLSKNFLAQVLLVGLQGDNLTQIWLLVGLDAMMLVLGVALKPFKTKLHHLHVILLCTVQFGISTCLLILNLGGRTFTPEQRENQFAYSLVAMYITAILTAVVPLIYDAGVGMLNKIRSQRPARSGDRKPAVKDSKISTLFAKKPRTVGNGSPKSSTAATVTSSRQLNIISPRSKPARLVKSKTRRIEIGHSPHSSSMRRIAPSLQLDSSPTNRSRQLARPFVLAYPQYWLPGVVTPSVLSMRTIQDSSSSPFDLPSPTKVGLRRLPMFPPQTNLLDRMQTTAAPTTPPGNPETPSDSAKSVINGSLPPSRQTTSLWLSSLRKQNKLSCSFVRK